MVYHSPKPSKVAGRENMENIRLGTQETAVAMSPMASTCGELNRLAPSLRAAFSPPPMDHRVPWLLTGATGSCLVIRVAPRPERSLMITAQVRAPFSIRRRHFPGRGPIRQTIATEAALNTGL